MSVFRKQSKSNASDNYLQDFQSWWREEQLDLMAEVFFEAEGYERLALPRERISLPGGKKVDCALELWEGIPLIVVRTPNEEELDHFTFQDNLLDVFGNDFGKNELIISTKEGIPVDSLSEPERKRIFKYFRNEYPRMRQRMENDVHMMGYDEFERLGKDFKSALCDGLCGDFILDENDIHAGTMYLVSKFLSPDELQGVMFDSQKRVAAFFGEQYEKGHMKRDEYERMVAFSKKSIADKFHPWTFLKGRMNHRLANLSTLSNEVTTVLISSIAAKAMSSPEYAPYRKEILEWAEKEAVAFNVSKKEVLEQVNAIPGITTSKGGNKLPNKSITAAAKKKFGNRL